MSLQGNKSTSLGLFALALTTLMLEVLLTRVFDVILHPNLAYMIISGAMFGLGLGGLYEILRREKPDADPSRRIANVAFAYAAVVWLLPVIFNLIPFDLDAIADEPFRQLASFLALYLILVLPFFLAGLAICIVFSTYTLQIQRLYFWDLSGAALGSALLIPFLPQFGAEWLFAITAALAIIAATLFIGRRSALFAGGIAAAAALALPLLLGTNYLQLQLHQDKRNLRTAIDAGLLEFSRWDAVSKIDIVPETPFAQKHIAYDGGSQSSRFYPFDGDLGALRADLPAQLRDHFWNKGVLASHYLKRDTGHDVLIIGSAGGQETKAALLYGAGKINAVEMVGTVVELAVGQYADYIGRLFNHPVVTATKGEGRSFLRASKDSYDVIQIFSNHTSSSIAAGSGAMSPVYLQTVEAYKEYFSRLADDGILHINHHVYSRMVSTAAAAWRDLGRTDFRRHVVVFEREGMTGTLPTLLIKMTPWTQSEIQELHDLFAMSVRNDPDVWTLREDPIVPERSFLSEDFYTGMLPESVIDRVPYRVSVVTDDKPYFSFLRKDLTQLQYDADSFVNNANAFLMNSQLRGRWIAMDVAHLAVVAVAGLFYGALLIGIPLLASRVGREPWRGKSPSITYFACLGLGFIIIQLCLIQLFMKLIGYPVYTIATVITTMLVAAALGSMNSARLVGRTSHRWYLAFGGIVICGLLLLAGQSLIVDAVISSPTAVRVIVAGLLIFPLGFFLGMPFPLGMLEMASRPRGAVAWGWSINGLFTVIGSLVSVLSALFIGFRWTILLALAIYVLAGAMFLAIRRSSQHVAVKTQEIPPSENLVSAFP